MKDLNKLIKNYADAYKALDDYQKDKKNKNIIPIGDQKTGTIGEYIGKNILSKILDTDIKELEFCGHSQKGKDVVYIGNDVKRKGESYQIKTISFYNKHKRTSKLKHTNKGVDSIDGLLIIYLDETFFLLL